MSKIFVISKVVLDNGKEYIFEEHPADLLRRIYNKKTGKIKHGFIHGNGFSIAMSHITAIEDIKIKEDYVFQNEKEVEKI